MKTLAIFLGVVAVATAQLAGGHPGNNLGAGAAAGSPTQGVGGQFFTPPKPINYGPKVYGQGHLNTWAIPPNPYAMTRALQLINNNPNALLRLDLNGEITITDRYGQEMDLIGPFGQEIDFDF